MIDEGPSQWDLETVENFARPDPGPRAVHVQRVPIRERRAVVSWAGSGAVQFVDNEGAARRRGDRIGQRGIACGYFQFASETGMFCVPTRQVPV